MISYKPLFHTLLDKNVNLTDLSKAGLNSRVIAKFKKDEHVNSSTLEKICLFLDCKIQDVIEVLPEEDSSKLDAKE